MLLEVFTQKLMKKILLKENKLNYISHNHNCINYFKKTKSDNTFLQKYMDLKNWLTVIFKLNFWQKFAYKTKSTETLNTEEIKKINITNNWLKRNENKDTRRPNIID